MAASPLEKAYRQDVALVKRAHRLGFLALSLASRAGDVIKVPGVGVIVSDASAIRSVLGNTQDFSKTGKGSSGDLWTQVLGPRALMNMDGDAHTTLRQLLGPLFTNGAIEKLVDQEIEPQLSAVRQRLTDGETIDLVREIELSTGRLVCRFAGYDTAQVGEGTVVEYLGRARAPLGLLGLRTRGFTEEQVAFIRESLRPIEEQVRFAYRNSLEGSIPNALKSFGLDEDDSYAIAAALVLTSVETVIAHIPRFISLLIQSGEAARLARERERLESVINEGFRVTVPSPVMLRVARSHIAVSRQSLKPGDRVILSNYMAQQRIGAFNPDRSVPKEMRQLWFGAGPHFCLGMPLAWRQTVRYTETLLDVEAMNALEIVASAAKQKTLAAGYDSLEIRCKP